ncbi:MAG: DsbA family protein [Nitrososphaeraceae archaeon]
MSIFKMYQTIYLSYSLVPLVYVIFFLGTTGFISTFAQLESVNQSPLIQRIVNPVDEMVPIIETNDSKIVIVEFGDYQCIHCANFNMNDKDLLISEYVDTGQASYMFKDFPVNDRDDKLSTLAAEASYCAAEQNMYWEYHDELFRNTERNTNQNWVTIENLNEFAKNIGVDDGRDFEDCLNSHKYLRLVEENESLAMDLGLPSTPSFIITNANGTSTTNNNTKFDENMILMIGEHPYTDFGEAIAQINDMNNKSA